MKRALSVMFGVLCLFAVSAMVGTPDANADCRRRVVVPHAIVTPVIAVANVAVATTFVPVPIAAYQVNYAPQADASLLAEIRSLRTEVQRLQSVQAAPQPQANNNNNGNGNGNGNQNGAHPGAVFLANSCVKCHSADVAKAKGGGNVFFDGGNLVATAEQKLAMVEAVRSQTMPRDGKSTEDEFNAMVNFLATAGKATAQKQPVPMPPANK